jgi:hypothetical protein
MIYQLPPLTDSIGLLTHCNDDYLTVEQVTWLHDNVGHIVSDHTYFRLDEVERIGDMNVHTFLNSIKETVKGKSSKSDSYLTVGRNLEGQGWKYERQFIFSFAAERLNFKSKKPLQNQYHHIIFDDDMHAMQFKLTFL